jgi:hypothetical protein
MKLMRHSDIPLTMNYHTDTNHLPLSDAIAKLPAFTTGTTGTNTQIHPQTTDVCSQIESHLGIQRPIEERSNIIHPDRFSPQLAQVDTAKNGSRGRIRTYDQSVNPDEVGTLPLSYTSDRWRRRSRTSLADFQDLISRSRRIALARSGCCSNQTNIHGPFLRVNLPEILSVRL